MQKCISYHDPELANIKITKIRAAYATNAILKHKADAGESAGAIEEAEFI